MADDITPATFDPKPYLRELGPGRYYLDVKWRLLWFRTVCPDGHISTELIEHDANERRAVVKATATGLLGARATGYGQASAATNSFSPTDYLEKAETTAVGRALAHLGYGAQFVDDPEPGQGDKLADSPVSRPAQNGRTSPPATAKQLEALERMAAHRNTTLELMCASHKRTLPLTVSEASDLIKTLQAE